MLRNRCSALPETGPAPFLNEVLSLNAQECDDGDVTDAHDVVLNEVLSLNAQEFGFLA